MDQNFTHRTGNRVEIHRLETGIYEVDVSHGPLFTAGTLNIGSRAAALPDGATLELGGGEADIIIEGYDDTRAGDGDLLAVGFSAEAIL